MCTQEEPTRLSGRLNVSFIKLPGNFSLSNCLPVFPKETGNTSCGFPSLLEYFLLFVSKVSKFCYLLGSPSIQTTPSVSGHTTTFFYLQQFSQPQRKCLSPLTWSGYSLVKHNKSQVKKKRQIKVSEVLHPEYPNCRRER